MCELKVLLYCSGKFVVSFTKRSGFFASRFRIGAVLQAKRLENSEPGVHIGPHNLARAERGEDLDRVAEKSAIEREHRAIRALEAALARVREKIRTVTERIAKAAAWARAEVKWAKDREEVAAKEKTETALDEAWLSKNKALAGQWNEQKEKAAREEGSQWEAKQAPVVPLHERWGQPKKEGLVKRIISARREAAEERQREQDQEAWKAAKPEWDATEQVRRAWLIENSSHFQALSVRDRRGIAARWDEKFPPTDEIQSPGAREKRIDTVLRGMNGDAYHAERWELERPEREAEAAWRAKIALEREQNKDMPKTPDLGRGY